MKSLLARPSFQRPMPRSPTCNSSPHPPLQVGVQLYLHGAWHAGAGSRTARMEDALLARLVRSFARHTPPPVTRRCALQGAALSRTEPCRWGVRE